MSVYLKLQRGAFVCVVLALAGCATKPAEVAHNAPPTMPANSAVSSSIIPGSLKDFQVNVGDTVHFDYNRSDFQDADRTVLQRQAAWLNKYPGVRATVQGNCDERGTREYNLALGARRAEAVKEYLVSLGVSAARLSTISYGKERPMCTESTEACWAQNRRAVTAITAGASS